MARDLNALFGAEPGEGGVMPPNPSVAYTLGCVFLKLGGSLSISSHGQRYIGKPEPCVFEMNGQGLPQIPSARPHQQFHSNEEWRGAINLIDALLCALDERDMDYLFDCFASVAVDDRKAVPSIEEPTRRALS